MPIGFIADVEDGVRLQKVRVAKVASRGAAGEVKHPVRVPSRPPRILSYTVPFLLKSLIDAYRDPVLLVRRSSPPSILHAVAQRGFSHLFTHDIPTEICARRINQYWYNLTLCRDRGSGDLSYFALRSLIDSGSLSARLGEEHGSHGLRANSFIVVKSTSDRSGKRVLFHKPSGQCPGWMVLPPTIYITTENFSANCHGSAAEKDENLHLWFPGSLRRAPWERWIMSADPCGWPESKLRRTEAGRPAP